MVLINGISEAMISPIFNGKAGAVLNVSDQ